MKSLILIHMAVAGRKYGETGIMRWVC